MSVPEAIKKAALHIAYDNGMVNRFTTEEEFLAGVEGVLGAYGVTQDEVDSFEAWLAELPEQDLETLCVGEHSEQEEIAKSCPLSHEGHRLTGLLNDIFEM